MPADLLTDPGLAPKRYHLDNGSNTDKNRQK